MAIQAVTITDFIGFWKVNIDAYQSEYFQQYLDQFQDKYIRYIIGASAWSEVNANGITSKQKWADLFNGVDLYFNENCDLDFSMCGLRDVLKGILYFVYVRDRMFDPTNSGNVQPLQEVSSRSNNVHNGFIASQRWNNAIAKLIDEVLPFIINYESLDEEVISSVDNGGGNYTLGVASTFYLEDGDTVRLKGVSYTVSNVAADTSFDISGAVIGADFTGETTTWEPYKDFPLCENLQSKLRAVGI